MSEDANIHTHTYTLLHTLSHTHTHNGEVDSPCVEYQKCQACCVAVCCILCAVFVRDGNRSRVRGRSPGLVPARADWNLNLNLKLNPILSVLSVQLCSFASLCGTACSFCDRNQIRANRASTESSKATRLFTIIKATSIKTSLLYISSLLHLVPSLKGAQRV